MPNHIYTRLLVSGPASDVSAFREKAAEGAHRLSFNKLFPLPQPLVNTMSPTRIVTPDVREKAVNEFEALSKDDPRREAGLPVTRAQQIALREAFGADNWYDWKVRNWGTKWGAYDVSDWETGSTSEILGTVCSQIFYHTAWSPATEFFIAVSKSFPTLTFHHDYADEGGNFVGFQVICNGQIVDAEAYEWSSEDGKAICKIVGYDRHENED